MPAHWSLDIAPVPESVSRSISTSSERSPNRLKPPASSAACRSSTVVMRSGSTEWIRNGSMIVSKAMRRSLPRVGVPRSLSVLAGDRVELRPIREADLAAFISAHQEIRNRGAFFPLGVQSEPALQRQYAETGLLGAARRARSSSGTATRSSATSSSSCRSATGTRSSSRTSSTTNDTPGRATRRRRSSCSSTTSPATKKHHRIHLVIVPENSASVRVAEKCGFTLEGTVRGAFFNDGRNHDVLLYSLLRTDPRSWHPPATTWRPVICVVGGRWLSRAAWRVWWSRSARLGALRAASA